MRKEDIQADCSDDAQREANFEQVPGRHAKQVVDRHVKQQEIDRGRPAE